MNKRLTGNYFSKKVDKNLIKINKTKKLDF